MTKKLKGAVIGCGGIAFEKYFPSLSKLKGLELVAFCDIIVEKAEKAAAAYGSIDAKAFYDYREVLANIAIGFSHITCLPDSIAAIEISACESFGVHT